MGQALGENDVLVFDDSDGVADSRGERGQMQVEKLVTFTFFWIYFFCVT